MSVSCVSLALLAPVLILLCHGVSFVAAIHIRTIKCRLFGWRYQFQSIHQRLNLGLLAGCGGLVSSPGTQSPWMLVLFCKPRLCASIQLMWVINPCFKIFSGAHNISAFFSSDTKTLYSLAFKCQVGDGRLYLPSFLNSSVPSLPLALAIESSEARG